MKRPLFVKKALAAMVALSLAGCTTFPADGGFGPGSGVVDVKDRAAKTLVVAWRAFDALLTAVQGLQAAGALTAGSPRALKVADLLDRTRNALNAATEAVRIGDQGSFETALAQAQKALEEAKAAIGGA
ncbi:MAG TPA: hypothetical protein VF759_11995 [Allosphingosinicella sp.]|jgi:hypothetical protein